MPLNLRDIMSLGRPTKFTSGMKERIKALALKGLTEAEICHAVDIDNSTLTKYKQRNPGFFTSLKDWKVIADKEIERSLRERAMGYSHPEDKIFLGKDGKPVIVPTIKHYPPDTTAMIFWLKNRQPAEWSDRKEIEHSVSGNSMQEVLSAIRGVDSKADGDA